MQNKSSKGFFLISFLPAMAYWYLEEFYPLRVAISAGLVLAILEISFEKIYLKHIHTLSKFNFVLILFLGGLSLLGDDGIWFRLQPCFTGVGISLFLIYSLSQNKGLLFEMMEQLQPNRLLPKEIVLSMEWHMAIFLGLYGFFMGGVAFLGNTDQWLFFKTIGFYIVFGLFMIFEMIFIRRKIKKMILAASQPDNIPKS